jgi:hypothetical protein
MGGVKIEQEQNWKKKESFSFHSKADRGAGGALLAVRLVKASRIGQNVILQRCNVAAFGCKPDVSFPFQALLSKHEKGGRRLIPTVTAGSEGARQQDGFSHFCCGRGVRRWDDRGGGRCCFGLENGALVCDVKAINSNSVKITHTAAMGAGTRTDV